MNAREAADIVNIVRSVVTPHDTFQDGLLLFVALGLIVVGAWQIIHYLWHKQRGDFYDQ